MKLIGLSGHKRSGKNSVYMLAKLILDEDETGAVRKIAFADEIRKLAREACGWDGLKDAKGRKLLQELGVGMREKHGKDFWVNLWTHSVYRAEKDGAKVVFVTDVRFPNEVNAVRNLGGVVWRLNRRGGPIDTHISETALDDYREFDLVLDAPDMEALFYQVRIGLGYLGLIE